MRTPPLRRRTDQETGDSLPLRALVVDHHDSYREYIAALVTRFGFTVTACADGAEAYAQLSQGHPFDLLVIDREIPRVNDRELITAVRDLDSHGDIYALMLTSRGDVETRIEALNNGFDDFMLKSSEMEITAKLTAARRMLSHQKRLDETVRELYGLATRDELTGLLNRRFFFAEAERLLAEGTIINLIFFDLDRFKWVNDTYGHLAGDRILRDIGALFLKRTRSEDLIARYGGDEFLMLVTNLPPDEAEALAHRISSEIGAAQWIFGTEVFSVGVTTGLACSSLLQNPIVSQLLSAGDRDLYKNKWLRKNPDQDPSLYEYDTTRDAHVVEMLTFHTEDVKARNE